MIEFNKGGRPRKKAVDKMNYKVTVKMSTVEYYTLKSKVKEADVSISEFVRSSIKKSSVVQRLTPEMHDEIRKLTGMANNLNQIARKANALGYDHVRTEYLFLANKIDRLLDKLL